MKVTVLELIEKLQRLAYQGRANWPVVISVPVRVECEDCNQSWDDTKQTDIEGVAARPLASSSSVEIHVGEIEV